MGKISLLQRAMGGLSGGFVLAFHEIQPERLAEFVDSLRPAQPVHLSELVARRKQSRPTAGLLAITVDDGVGENTRNLARFLQARGWPATFYLPTQYLDTGVGMPFQWWRAVKPLLPRKKLVLKCGVIDLSTAGARNRLSRQMELLWRSRRPESYLPLTMELVEIALREHRLSRAEIAPPPPITWAEVADLASSDLIRFESHGVSHSAMCSLTEEELVFEMKHSRSRIAELTGRPCRHLCYPFGSLASIGPRAASVAERFYDSAVTMTLGSVDFANPWLLPRIPLYAKNSILFARLKVMLKCSSLPSRKRVMDGPQNPISVNWL
jgi:peptidoglycan/xylan/chitin deacetylase (PgdA/CDA1 family)